MIANIRGLTLSLQNKLSSANFLDCCHFKSASMMLKVGENVVWWLTFSPTIATKVTYANNLDPDETLSNSASHLDTSCLTLRQRFH